MPESSPSNFSKWWPVLGLIVLANLALLTANVVWAWRNAERTGLWSGGAAQATRDAEAMEMDLVCVRYPLAVFVDKEFSANHKYVVVDYDGNASLHGDEADLTYHDKATRSLELWLGTGFKLGCSYSVSDEIEAHDLHLLREGNGAFAGVFDLDADGTYDVRIQHREGDAPNVREIWYEGAWREVEDQATGDSRYERKLNNGTRVEFDQDQGKWIVAESDPN